MASFFGAVESVSKFAPDRLRASVTNGQGFASPSRFEVDFPSIDGMTSVDGSRIKDPSNSEDRNLFCTAAGIPGKQVSTVNRGIGIENKMIVNGHTFPDVTFSFYLANTYVMRHYFEEWMKAITSQDPSETNYVGYYDNYVKPVKIRQYTRNARKSYSLRLIDAYPTNIGTVELNNQLQTAVAEVTVSMSYRTYIAKQSKSGII